MAEIITKKEGPIGNIIFSNPQKMNAMSLDMWLGVPKAMREFDQDPEVRVIVVKGGGEKAFISFSLIHFSKDAAAKTVSVTFCN